MKNSKRNQWTDRVPLADDVQLNAAAVRMAQRCRRIVQGCLREEEWRDCDQEFFAIILEELQRLSQNNREDSGGRWGCPRPPSRENE